MPAPRSSAHRSPAGNRWRSHGARTLKFLTVGGTVFVIDAALYNLLVFWHPAVGWGEGFLHDLPLLAKTLTVAFASVLTYLGNRLWTFQDRPRPRTGRSVVLFIAVNVVATALQLAPLGISRYVLGWSSPLTDNVSANLIGQVLSTGFRYLGYGRWVFPPEPAAAAAQSPELPVLPDGAPSARHGRRTTSPSPHSTDALASARRR